MRNQLLRDSDLAEMALSLEIRVPLVDRFLVEQIGHLAKNTYHYKSPKQLLSSSTRPALPDELLNREKTGFGVPMGKLIENNIQYIHHSPHYDYWAKTWARICIENTRIGVTYLN